MNIFTQILNIRIWIQISLTLSLSFTIPRVKSPHVAVSQCTSAVSLLTDVKTTPHLRTQLPGGWVQEFDFIWFYKSNLFRPTTRRTTRRTTTRRTTTRRPQNMSDEDHMNTRNQTMYHTQKDSKGSQGACPGSLDNCIAACPASPVGGHSSQKLWQFLIKEKILFHNFHISSLFLHKMGCIEEISSVHEIIFY